jgi:hypothetical protein
LTAIGARWDENYDLTENYSSASDVVTSCTEYAAFDHISDPSPQNPEFAIGLYKISAVVNSVEQAYFFMDWRTSDWSSSLDVEFKYDVGNTRFRDWDNTQTIDYTYQTLWDLTDNYLETTGLEDYWENCLGLIHDSDFHPKLVWGPYPDTTFNVTGYKVYRAVSTFSSPVPTTFSYLSTVGSTQYYYEDDQYDLGHGWYAFYKVTAIDGMTESDYSNVATTSIDAFNKKDNSDKRNSAISNYSLNQNYPNPFNPTTVISYSIAKEDLVTLKLFDILGSEVTLLVEGQKEAGTHRIEFDASNLPSGIYFYQLQTGNFIETRKLILQK